MLCAVEHGLRCWNALMMSCLTGTQFGTSDVDGQAKDLLGRVVCQRDGEEIWSGSETNSWIRDTCGRNRV